MKNQWLLGVPALLLLAGSLLIFSFAPKATSSSHQTLKVLSYSSFISSWGPGPWVAQEFEKKTGIHVEYQDGGDAGLLLAKLKLFPSDVVVGFNQLLLDEARSQTSWQSLAEPPYSQAKNAQPDFVSFDWAPLSFVYRKTVTKTVPRTLDDLLSAPYAHSLSLEDPRTSAPGLLFFYWVLDSKGVDAGFDYLKKLKASITRVSPSWSTAYGFFTKSQAPFVFSYFTSPVYHALNEHDQTVSAVAFDEGQPVEVEYAGSPASCSSCNEAKQFLAFLLEPDVQRKIMTVNAMFPVIEGLTAGTAFERLPKFRATEFHDLKTLQAQRAQLLQRWQELGL